MNRRTPTIRPSCTATRPGEEPKGFSRCFHLKNSAVRPPVGPPPRATPSSSMTAGSSASVSVLTSSSVAVVLIGSPPPHSSRSARSSDGSGCRRPDRSRTAGLVPWLSVPATISAGRSVASRRSAAASDATSRAGTSSPSRSWPTTSGMPPTAVTTGGTPAAMASSMAIGSPSCMLDRLKTSKAGRRSGTSSRTPVNITEPSSARLVTRSSRCCSARAVTDEHEPCVGDHLPQHNQRRN